jgi:hypothetical protein
MATQRRSNGCTLVLESVDLLSPVTKHCHPKGRGLSSMGVAVNGLTAVRGYI